MIISLFDVNLKTVAKQDLELIRYWRNSPKIRNRMEYRETITVDQHLNWFETYNNFKTGFAYIIIYEKKKIGVIYSKINKGFSEGGMFLWDDIYVGSMVPVLVSLMMTDLNFYVERNNFSQIKMLKDNTSVINFNTNLGYVLCSGQENKYNQQYVLTRKAYEERVAVIKKKLASVYKKNYEISICIRKRDMHLKGFAAFNKKYLASNKIDWINIIAPTSLK